MTHQRYDHSQRPDPRPLPPEIYTRRRVAALVIILVLVGLLVWGLTAWARSGSGQEQPDSTAPATPTEQITTSPTVPAPSEETTTTPSSPSSSASSGASSPSASTSANAAAKDTCELGDLDIVAQTSEPSYAAGQQPVFYMEVKNPTKADCVINLDQDKLRFEVYTMADNQRVWSDVDCYPPVVAGEQTFAPGEPRKFEAKWSATGSKPGQCKNREPVGPGSYYLHAVIGDSASNPADFTLR
ncbi:hypothetical protein [Corynebacterium liangguodongii]|uniref:Uncharacterized protein n=1 Tax=Corynebacterium liangguodongii TaxID=2079535 RepID=A0A2S0WFT7_9CORY|nr:hypothetical protein [Corynebacterium liangguodongii]AWB84647.1 hypothetical protein C3E79_09325 [Corynebacterium liangguodongii]PWB99655.1 hypothetical protein DF219_05105 [Corynebacterium liangguodongii]